MYFKLALSNVKKSYKDYLVYFLTIVFSVALFYSFNSFEDQEALLSLSNSSREMVKMLFEVMSILSVFVSIVLVFLILYANNFLIKRRKKELGLYTILGMPKGKMSKILIYETALIGIFSLVTGLVIGVIFSQALTVFTATLFEVSLNYKFMFSMHATIVTICAFAIIFFIVMLFNTLILNKYKLIDLLNAERKSESLKILNIQLSVILFIISVCLLGWDYYQMLVFGFMKVNILRVIVIGSVGTLLFFMSLAGFLLKFAQCSKKLYFKNLNMFVLRQISSKMNSNFASMSVVCIMLLLSIGALSTGINLNSSSNASLKNMTPYDFSSYITTFNVDSSINNEFLNEIEQYNESISDQTKDEHYLYSYFSEKATLGNLMKKFSTDVKDIETIPPSLMDQPLEIIKLSDFNKQARNAGKEEITLASNEARINTLYHSFLEDILIDFDYNNTLEIFNKDIKLVEEYSEVPFATSQTSSELYLIVNDDIIPANINPNTIYYNANVEPNADMITLTDNYQNKLSDIISADSNNTIVRSMINNKTEILEANKGMSITFIYIGLYLGIIFIISSAVILALQQLSDASDNVKRYNTLRQIGTEEKMINHTLLLQIGIYFMLPLLLAIAHCYVGITSINDVIVMMGQSSVLSASLITGCIIGVIYLAYFYVTYSGYKAIIKKKKN
ncbi:MAG: FtsX-like permease family protein [Erysipelotrichaceae bacterium]